MALEKRLGGESLELRRCRRCTHGFLSHQPEHFESERYEYYRSLLTQPRALRQTELNARRYRELLASWGAQVRGRRLLDVGCGDGHLVAVANESGWSARGIDMAEGAIEVARAWGIPCARLDFFDRSLDEERFDVIYMSELVEHVPTPGSFLGRAESLLAPGGLVYLTTPNFDALARRALGGAWANIHFEHLGYFNQRSLETLVNKATHLRIEVSSRNVALPSIVRGLRARVLPRAGTHGQADAGAAGATRDADQVLRRRIYGSPALLAGMRVANGLASALRLGDTLVATLR